MSSFLALRWIEDEVKKSVIFFKIWLAVVGDQKPFVVDPVFEDQLKVDRQGFMSIGGFEMVEKLFFVIRFRVRGSKGRRRPPMASG